MKLRGQEFGSVMNASGARGFFGETGSFQWPVPVQPDWSGSTFVAKTSTLHKRIGNMLFKEDSLTAIEKEPGCIIVKPEQDAVLNSVGLSGPGIEFLLNDGRWQQMTEPFFISYMSVAPTSQERLDELNQFVDILQKRLPEISAPLALQINFSCPNVGLHLDELNHEVGAALDAAQVLTIPLVPKFNVLLPSEDIIAMSHHHAFDAVCISNTVPWGQLEQSIAWQKIFSTSNSPLAHIGGGGLSGKPLLEPTVAWIQGARKKGFTKPIIGGAGILSVKDALAIKEAGADAISMGSIGILHPENVQPIINFMNSHE
jgi:dihydroorotate dehydrogenase